MLKEIKDIVLGVLFLVVYYILLKICNELYFKVDEFLAGYFWCLIYLFIIKRIKIL